MSYCNYAKKGEGTLVWCSRQGDVHCRVGFIWHPLLEQYVLNGIYFDDPLSFTLSQKNSADYYFVNGYPKKLSNVFEIHYLKMN